MELGLKGKSVLVTAASKGLGKASAIEFAKEGALVTIASRNLEELERTAAEIQSLTGQTVHVVQLDVADAEQVKKVVRSAAEFGGGLHVLVTNAGGPPSGKFDEFDDTQWDDAYELNLKSAVRLIREALPHLRGEGGRIVTLTSSSIKQPIDGLVLSNVFRAGINALAKTLSIELGNDGILVNNVAPGRIATDRVAFLDEGRAMKQGISPQEVKANIAAGIPLGRYGTPEEFGTAVAFLGSFANTYITGQSLLVDGGMIKSI